MCDPAREKPPQRHTGEGGVAHEAGEAHPVAVRRRPAAVTHRPLVRAGHEGRGDEGAAAGLRAPVDVDDPRAGEQRRAALTGRRRQCPLGVARRGFRFLLSVLSLRVGITDRAARGLGGWCRSGGLGNSVLQ